MTSTASAAAFLPAEHLHDERLAAELRHVTSGSRRTGATSFGSTPCPWSPPRRGDQPAEPARQVGGLAARPLDGRASASWGSVLRDERAARVQPGYGIYPRLTVRQNLVIAQRRSGRAADLRLDRPGDRGTRARRDARLPRRAGGWRAPGEVGGGPQPGGWSGAPAGRPRFGRGAWPDKPGLISALGLAAHRMGVAAVVATRDPWTAAATDRVVRMNRGRVLDDTGAAD